MCVCFHAMGHINFFLENSKKLCILTNYIFMLHASHKHILVYLRPMKEILCNSPCKRPTISARYARQLAGVFETQSISFMYICFKL
jgi:hypothetical protein